MSECVVYHWWKESYDRSLPFNLRTPIIQSICTLRNVDPTIPIYILTESIENWKPWQDLFEFSIIPTQLTYRDKYAHRAGFKHLSRIADIWKTEFKEDKIIYCDSDVFWLKSPRPTYFSGNKFSFNKYNSGFFYYDKNSPVVKNFHDVFLAYILTALNDENFRIIHRQYVDYKQWYYVLDETMLTYMTYKLPHLFDIISINEHCTVGMSAINMPDPNLVKMFHAHGIIIQEEHARGLIPLMFKELYCDKLELLYSKEILNKYKPDKSLFDLNFWTGLPKSKDNLYII